ncbi:MAG: nodulation protein NfeD [Acidobacteriota bacterium]
MRPILLLVILLATSTAQGEIFKVRIDGIIDPITAEFITGAVARAEAQRAEILLLELSTPGGLGVSMQEIIQVILNSEVPVVCYVGPKGARAASAGFFILLSADLAVMAPGTNTGAAHPVFPLGGGDETMLEKVTNDALANLRAIVSQRERNYEMAEKGVVESKSYTAQEALEGGLIDLIVEDEEELLKELHGREITRFSGERQYLETEGQELVLLEMTLRQQILSSIADPNMALLLGVLGLLGLYLEFTNPGLIVPGIIGGICFILALLGFSLLPINFIGVLLILLAIGLFVAELMASGFGVFGVGGIVAMTLGLLVLIDAPNPEVRIQWGTALAVAVAFGTIIVFLLRLVLKSIREKVILGTGSLEGSIGQARTPVNTDGGKVFVSGEWWQAKSESPIEEGSQVRIVGSKDLVLTVELYSRSDFTSNE